jgi:Putative zinc-finger
MKCEVCSELLEEYLDGELAPRDREGVGEHLIGCVDCSTKFEALTAEQELFARYDREIEVPPFLWTRIAEHALSESREAKRGWFGMRLAGAMAVLVIAVVVGIVYFRSRQAPPAPETFVTQQQKPQPEVVFGRGLTRMNADLPRRGTKRAVKRVTVDEAGVLSSDLGYPDIDEQDTARHIEQTQILLRSIKNLPVSDSDEEVDVSYDKALSRRLLNENVVLRRDAEMKAKFPTKTLLADLEPFLIDIANLPDHARPEDVRVIKERVQKTEIVAALLDYQEAKR